MTKRPLLWAFLLVAFLIGAAGARGILAPPPPALSTGETVTLTGTVEEITEKENSRQLRLSHIYLSSDLSYQRQVLVYENQQTELKIGYWVKVTGTYAPLEEAANPGQFDQKAYYEARGIGMVLKKAKLMIIEAKENFFFQKLYELRSFWARTLETITGKEEDGLLQAMLLGEKSGLKKEQKELYQSGGISHILAISGLHISLVGMLLYQFLRKKKRSYPFSAAVSGSFMVVYGFLTGFGVSAKRAVFMFLVYLGAEVLGETYDVVFGAGACRYSDSGGAAATALSVWISALVPLGGSGGSGLSGPPEKARMEKQDGFELVVRSFGDAGYAALYALLVL